MTTMKKNNIEKRKYWYRNDIEICVLCGKEKHNKKRVYNIKERGVFVIDTACHDHF